MERVNLRGVRRGDGDYISLYEILKEHKSYFKMQV